MRIDASATDIKVPNIKTEPSNSAVISSDKENVVKQIDKKAEQAAFPGEKKLVEAIEKANKELVGMNTSLKFSIHEKTKQILVKIVDNDTKEVVKEIPPEKILDMVADMCERAGIFVDKRG